MTDVVFEAEVRGGPMYGYRYGPDDDGAPTILAVHGVTASSRAWLSLAAELTGYRILAPDLRGRARSRDLPPPFGRSEPDPEIQDLLRRSHGLNVGIRYLDGAFNFDPTAAGDVVTPEFAARLVWLDALVTNPDRTHRNPNLLVWQRRPWLIDHGAALYIHHDWGNATAEKARAPFPLIASHVLLGRSDGLERADAELASALTTATLRRILELLPDELLAAPEIQGEGDPAMHRARYFDYLAARLESPRAFVAAAVDAREALRRSTPRPRSARR